MGPVSTPPPTTLSTPSPTEIDGSSDTQEHLNTEHKMRWLSTARPIYLIVATALSPPLGIGIRGGLPWSQIRTDMAFFRKVTSGTQAASDQPSVRNAVLMGRKTWESIPPRFRPLSGRINVVITRADEAGLERLAGDIKDELVSKDASTESGQSWTAETVRDQTGQLVRVSNGEKDEVVVTNSLRIATTIDQRVAGVNEVYCIGGAEIYGMVLNNADNRSDQDIRVLQTLVKKVDGGAFECDTFWPQKMEDGADGWREVGSDEVRMWIGSDLDLPQGRDEWCRDEKADVNIRVIGWERKAV